MIQFPDFFHFPLLKIEIQTRKEKLQAGMIRKYRPVQNLMTYYSNIQLTITLPSALMYSSRSLILNAGGMNFKCSLTFPWLIAHYILD
jgi:hypothetical protein